MTQKPKNMFVDKAEMLAKVIEYKKMVKFAEEHGLERPGVPAPLAQDVYNIAENLSRRSNFIGYPYRHDMIMSAVESCLKYMHRFDSDKYDNPFGWVTRISWNCFINMITLEKKNLYVKLKAEQAALHEFTYLIDGGPEVSLNDSQYANDFIRDYEEKNLPPKKTG